MKSLAFDLVMSVVATASAVAGEVSYAPYNPTPAAIAVDRAVRAENARTVWVDKSPTYIKASDARYVVSMRGQAGGL